MSLFKRVWFAALVAASGDVVGCSRAPPPAGRLADAGQVEAKAPIKAAAVVVIKAPEAKIWRLITDVDRWPTWQLQIKDARLTGPLKTGSLFTWRTGGLLIHSRLGLVQVPKKIAWSGEAFGLHAAHVWTLKKTSSGVEVRTDETMSGLPLSLVYSSAALQRADASWLAALKKTAETGSP
jgi:hypothetical protein